VIGKITDTGHIVLKHRGAIVGDIPLPALVDNSPVYERPFKRPASPQPLTKQEEWIHCDVGAALIELMGTADLCSKRWITDQYDRSVMADTIESPGADAALVRVHDTMRRLPSPRIARRAMCKPILSKAANKRLPKRGATSRRRAQPHLLSPTA